MNDMAVRDDLVHERHRNRQFTRYLICSANQNVTRLVASTRFADWPAKRLVRLYTQRMHIDAGF
jgi:hypothetical protein